jgi:hypothetical protein
VIAPGRQRDYWRRILVHDLKLAGAPDPRRVSFIIAQNQSVLAFHKTSRASIRSAPSCLTFDPVTAMASPLLSVTPISFMKAFGHK